MVDKNSGKVRNLSDYVLLLRNNKYYRYCFIAYCIDNIGNWLTFIACLTVADRLGGALFVSYFLVLRLSPFLLFSFFFAMIADTINKRIGLIVCSIISGTAVLLLTIPIHKNLEVYMFFFSVALQWTFCALYEPIRRSLIPLLVEQEDLQIATSIDSAGWAAIGAFGAAVGGFITSVLGIKTAFVLDFITYLLCAYFLYLIPQEKCQLNSSLEICKTELELTNTSNNQQHVEVSTENKILLNHHFSIQTVQNVISSAYIQIIELYELLSENKLIIFLCCIKGSGALIWGTSDLLNVKYSQMQRMQSLGDNDITLGIIFAFVGVGCQIGPLIYNSYVSQKSKALFIAIILSFLKQCLGYIILMYANNIYLVLLATMIRCVGSSVIWVYSTLIIQLEAPVNKQGRVFTLEGAIAATGEIVSMMFGGYAFDMLLFDLWTLNFTMALVGAVIVVLWYLVFLVFFTNICFGNNKVEDGKREDIEYSKVAIEEEN